MGICLIGTPGSRRWEYFRRAAESCETEVWCIDWQQAGKADLRGNVVKIDPPSWTTADIASLNAEVKTYRTKLHALSETGAAFLNTPEALEAVLDKCLCKRILAANEVAVTEVLAENVHTVEQLHACMREKRAPAVFVKPAFGSGAAGVLAYRRHPGRDSGVLVTSCCLRDGELINTKKIYHSRQDGEIARVLSAVLSLGAIVERWHPKDSWQGKSYDLRVVWQFGKIEYIVARQSAGPITNLHLNNMALDWERLGLPERTVEEIRALCRKAMACFPGLAVAGIDILLERGSLRPRIIEINGQGDLIYRDIFEENRIYKKQILHMKQHSGAGG